MQQQHLPLCSCCCLLLAAAAAAAAADVLVKEAREKGGKTKIQLARGCPKYRTDFVPEVSSFRFLTCEGQNF
jgi:hypothetical protein